MPLQNRVSSFGELCAFCARGLFMGNRGGRFHTDAKTLTRRRWASRQWICCVLEFKGRRRDVWGRFYTELFFLDEPTALAAGHGLASSAAAKTRRPLRKNGARRADLAGCPARRRWTMFCITNAYEVAPSACIDATSTSCPTAHLPHLIRRPSRFKATHCCAGHQTAIMAANRGRPVFR